MQTSEGDLKVVGRFSVEGETEIDFRLFWLLFKWLFQTTQAECKTIKSLIFLFCFDVSTDHN